MPCHQNFLFLLENQCDNKAHDLLPLRYPSVRTLQYIVQYYKQLCSGARRCYTCAHQDTRQEKLTFAKCIISHKTFSGIENHHRKISVSRKSLLSIHNLLISVTYFLFRCHCKMQVDRTLEICNKLDFPKNTTLLLLILNVRFCQKMLMFLS